jgi:hypothetical protein
MSGRLTLLFLVFLDYVFLSVDNVNISGELFLIVPYVKICLELFQMISYVNVSGEISLIISCVYALRALSDNGLCICIESSL